MNSMKKRLIFINEKISSRKPRHRNDTIDNNDHDNRTPSTTINNGSHKHMIDDNNNYYINDDNDDDQDNDNTKTTIVINKCGICLDQLSSNDDNRSLLTLKYCHCRFCKKCLDQYIKYMLDNGHIHIYCPSYQCRRRQSITIDELMEILIEYNEDDRCYYDKIRRLSSKKMMNQNDQTNNRLNNDHHDQQQQIKCPFCQQIFETIDSNLLISIDNYDDDTGGDETDDNNNDDNGHNGHDDHDGIAMSRRIELSNQHRDQQQNEKIHLLNCKNCKQLSCQLCLSLIERMDNINDGNGHNNVTNIKHNCSNYLNQQILAKYDIKKCPNCHYLLQRDGGCAQISCKNCLHIFCWYCSKSLDNDFLLFHYDSGECRNRLGHSRLSLLFNRTQTISICIGISLLLLITSPLLLTILPCILMKKRLINGQNNGDGGGKGFSYYLYYCYYYCCCGCCCRGRRPGRHRRKGRRSSSSDDCDRDQDQVSDLNNETGRKSKHHSDRKHRNNQQEMFDHRIIESNLSLSSSITSEFD